MRTISENASVKIARYGPLMRRHTQPMPPPSAQHMSMPAPMPSSTGMPSHFTSRAEV
jgi:hypothetical protein